MSHLFDQMLSRYEMDIWSTEYFLQLAEMMKIK
jgi:hypothetical protein